MPFFVAAKYCIMPSYNGLTFIQGFSLVDITASGVKRGNDPDNVERNQQRNWETVIQCMGLRTQPLHLRLPESGLVAMKNYEFGDFYQGEHMVWTWAWAVEKAEVYDLPDNPLGGLQQDFEQVPIITYLTDTARFMLPIFYPYGTIKNIYFKQLQAS